MADREVYSKEALKAQDGKRLPLTLEDGTVVGEVVFRYEEDTCRLVFDARLDNVDITNHLMEKLLHPEENEREDI
jgi:hypothetical protein